MRKVLGCWACLAGLLAIAPPVAAPAGGPGPAVAAADSAAPAAPTLDARLGVLDFEGIWLLDSARTDDAARLLAQGARQFPRHTREGVLGRGAHGPRGPAAPGGPPDSEEEPLEPSGTSERTGGDPRRAMERVLHPPRKLVIYVDGDRFQLEEDEGAARVYAISDSLAALGVRALNGEASVRIAGRALEAMQPLGRRGALHETFELSADRRTLSIRARREDARDGAPAVTVLRTYVRYEGD